jgi:hypothetical protein
MRRNDDILKMLIVKINNVAGVQCLPYEEQNSSFVYAMCYTKCAWMYAGTKTKQHRGVALRMASFGQKAACVGCVLEMISVSVFRAGSKPLAGERVCLWVGRFPL